ncbi:MAG: hypothetical protein AB1742_02120 [bacterium]
MMKLLHEIREKQLEESKGLSVEEQIKRTREKAEAFKKKYGLKLRRREIVRK